MTLAKTLRFFWRELASAENFGEKKLKMEENELLHTAPAPVEAAEKNVEKADENGEKAAEKKQYRRRGRKPDSVRSQREAKRALKAEKRRKLLKELTEKAVFKPAAPRQKRVVAAAEVGASVGVPERSARRLLAALPRTEKLRRRFIDPSIGPCDYVDPYRDPDQSSTDEDIRELREWHRLSQSKRLQGW